MQMIEPLRLQLFALGLLGSHQICPGSAIGMHCLCIRGIINDNAKRLSNFARFFLLMLLDYFKLLGPVNNKLFFHM